MKHMTVATTLVLVAIANVGIGDQQASPCPGCGCSRTKKVCRLVCEMKDDIDYEYDVDYDEYCLPDTSKIRGKKWVADCTSLLGYRKELIWQPRCKCKIHTRKTLVKIPVIKKVRTYNCIVDSVCCGCGKSHFDAEATARARQQGIMPDSVDGPIVLDTGEPFEAVARDEHPPERSQLLR